MTMSLAAAPKDPSIVAFVERVTGALGPAGWQVADHWDGDLCAIGIASASDPERLVYVCTYQQHAG